MKTRNYEKQEFIICVIIILLLLELLVGIFFFNIRIYKYRNIDGVVSKRNVVELMVSKEDRNILYKNGMVFLDNKYISYEIVENRGVLMRQKNTDYYDILVRLKMEKKYKSHDIINLAWKEKKESIFNLFCNVWRENSK